MHLRHSSSFRVATGLLDAFCMSGRYVGLAAAAMLRRRQTPFRPSVWAEVSSLPRPRALLYAASQTWLRILAAISALSCGRNRP